jgi:oxygen-independent coproporphyrinogen-3 oxidase
MTDPAPGLYVHVPFCSAKCPYCDFYSLAAPDLRGSWLEGIGREIEIYGFWPGPFDTVYLGGGTPSQLDDHHLADLMGFVCAFPRTPEAEVTIEANPEDVTRARASFFLGLGVNRISLGVQSLGDDELSFLGRRHTAGEAWTAAVAIREAGCVNLSLDFIYGLPGQKLEDWLATLNRALTLEPEHLSCYLLSAEKGTVFGQKTERGEVMVAGEEAAGELFLATSRFLQERGYVHYEVSSFSRGPDLSARHNRKYWEHVPYLGLGPAAHSFDGRQRWWNHRSVRRYCRDLAEGQPPVVEREVLTAEQLSLERLYLGLRTNRGADLVLVGNRELADDLVNRQLAVIQDGRLILNREGLLLADRLAVELA